MPSVSLSAGDRVRVITFRYPANRVMPLKEWRERNSLSGVAAWRILKSDDGPKVTQLTKRRIGIREDHNAEWLDRRVRG